MQLQDPIQGLDQIKLGVSQYSKLVRTLFYEIFVHRLISEYSLPTRRLFLEQDREYYYSETYGEEYDEGDPDYYDENYDEGDYNDRGM